MIAILVGRSGGTRLALSRFPGRRDGSPFKLSSTPSMVPVVDNTFQARHNLAPNRRTVALAVLVVSVSLVAFFLLRPHQGPTDPEAAGPPAGLQAVAQGTTDGVAWQQFAWTADDELCVQFAAGSSVTDCGHWGDDAAPFGLIADGDAPITDGVHAALTTVVQGIVPPTVTSVRVVGQRGVDARAMLSHCACDQSLGLTSFMLPVTAHDTAKDSQGRYVVVAAFEGNVEVGRVRVPIVNLGYCGHDDCK